MKKHLKKLSLKKQTLHLLNGMELNIRQGGADSYRCSNDKSCPLPSINQCSYNCPSNNTRCTLCNGLV